MAGEFIHPLLCVGKSEIEEALSERGVSWRIDATNFENDYTRNRVRNQVMGELLKINPAAEEHICRMAEKMSELWEYMEDETGTYIRECVEEKGDGTLIRKETFQKIPYVFREEVIRAVLADVCGSEKDLMAVHVRDILELMEKQPGRRLSLPYGVRAFRGYEGVLLRKGNRQGKPEAKQEMPRFRMRVFERRGKKSGRIPPTRNGLIMI